MLRHIIAYPSMMCQVYSSHSFEHENERKTRLGTRYVRTGRVLRSYFRVSKAVLSLIARIQDEPDLGKWIVLKNGPIELSWHEYFYKCDQYCNLYNYLARLKKLSESAGSKNEVPIAVVVSLSKKPFINKRQRWQVFGDKTECCLQRDRNSFIDITPSLFFEDRESADSLVEQELVLVCAIPGYPELIPSKNGYNECAYIGMNIIHRSQWCRIETSS